MGLLDQLLASGNGQIQGPNGTTITADYSGGTTTDAHGNIIPMRYSVTDPNGSQAPGTSYPIFSLDNNQQVGTGQFDTGNITFGDLMTGVAFVGTAALGGEALGGLAGGIGAEAGVGAEAGLGAEAGGGMAAGDAGLASDIGNLGAGSVADGSFDPSMFSFGADAAGDGSLMSSLGSALNGGTGFSKLAPLIGQLISGVNSRSSGNTANDLANRLIAAADPFAPYRAGYGQKLQALETSHDVSSIPGYQAGLEAVQRAGAAQGFTGSGNMMKALQDYGGNFYNAEVQRLAGLAGAGTTPGNGFATAAGLIGQGQASSNFGNQQLINSLAGILGPGNPIGNAFSSLGSGGSGNPLTSFGGADVSGADAVADVFRS